MSFILRRAPEVPKVPEPAREFTLLDVRKWPWDCHDMRTWKYSDYMLVGEPGNRKVVWIKNPKFAYRHLDKETNDVCPECRKKKENPKK